MAPRKRGRRSRRRGAGSHINVDFIVQLSTASKAITLADLGFDVLNRPIRIRSIDATFAIVSSATKIPTIQFLMSGPNGEHVVRSANVVVTPTKSRLRLSAPSMTDFGTFKSNEPIVTVFLNGHTDGVVTITGSVQLQFSAHSGPHQVAFMSLDTPSNS